MLKLVKYDTLIRLVRDDKEEFLIGANQEWQLLKNGGLDGFGEIKNTLTFIDNAVMDGGTFSGMHIGKVDRTIKCACVLLNENDVMRQKASQFFKPKSDYKVYITYCGRTRWAEAKLYKFDLATINPRDLMKMTITFTFANPYWKSVDNFGRDIAEVTPLFGFPWLINGKGGKGAKGLTAGIFNFAKVVVLENTGDTETRCKAVIRADGVVVNPKLIINGEYVRVIDTMQPNETIELDFEALPPTVKKNGQNYIGHCDRTSAFDEMILNVGDNTIQYTADDGSDKMSVSIYYSKLYGVI